ncbi:uncharacterized protein LOC133456285 [Cololabis saira]|uniref:uncharacterized protein LOC133456285 n=1 Tax=Cololabis saira TaxID=129043 RepID=UPI002AD2AD57|nr:uncharacterized protein LOC133456285 [Cololabis saira]
MACTSCGTLLLVEDGHELCPQCLGVGHLREALSDPCINCSILPLSVREDRLRQVEGLLFRSDLPPSGPAHVSAGSRKKHRDKRRAGPHDERSGPTQKKAKDAPSRSEMEDLRAELEQLKALVRERALPSPPLAVPWESDCGDDAMSTRASNSMFQGRDSVFSSGEYPSPELPCLVVDPASIQAEAGSETSLRSSGSTELGEGPCPLQATLRAALAKVGLDDAPAAQPASNPFFRRTPVAPPFDVPPSPAFLQELRRCWADPKAFAYHGKDARTLASMRQAEQHGLVHMPPVDPCIASLVLSRDEALIDKARCPRPQCRVTDSLLSTAYDAAGRMARIGNSLSVLLLAQSQMLQSEHEGGELGDTNDAALQAFGLMTRELGRLMSTLVVTRRQVWLAQAPICLGQRQNRRWSAGSSRVRHQRPGVVGVRAWDPQLSTPGDGAHKTCAAHIPRAPLRSPGSTAGLLGVVGVSPGAHTLHLAGLSGCRGNTSVPPNPQIILEALYEGLGPAVGRFSHQHLAYWAAHSPDVWVLRTLSQGYRLQFRRRPPPPSGVRETSVRDRGRALCLSQEIAKLLDKKAITRVHPHTQSSGFYSTYFLIPKKDTSLRPVLDLRGLNQYLKVLPFRMLRTRDVLQSVTPGEWFTSIDLKDAYFHVPIHPDHRRFLSFAFQGHAYQFTVLPFGLSLAPRIFTRCMRAALTSLCLSGVKILPYLDDWLICAPSLQEAELMTSRVLTHIEALGMSVNWEKSLLRPTQQTTFIGLSLDSVSMQARLTAERAQRIQDLLRSFRLGMRLPVHAWLRLLGMLSAASAVTPLGLLHLRPLQMWFNSLQMDPRLHRWVKVKVTHQCLIHLHRWQDSTFLLHGVPLGSVPSRREVVTTDASPQGWGAVWQKRSVQGVWGPLWRGRHINVLELRTVYLALRHFLPFLRGKHVLVRTDNTSTVFHVNHQGGTRSLDSLNEARRLWMWAHPQLASLRAMHLPGRANVVADSLSRRQLPPGDWRLHPQVVRMIWDRYGEARVDLFASECTTHCPLWFSLAETSAPLGMDALANTWPRGLLYAFPPIPLVMPTLHRVRLSGHRVLLVAPKWPSRIWFSTLLSLLDGEPWQLPVRSDLLSQLGGEVWHPSPSLLQLWAWPLRGKGHS